MTLGSGLQAGKVFPVRVTSPDEREHRRLLAEAINHVAAAAFTPYTQFQAIEDVDFTSAGADLGFSLSVTPYVAARAHVILVLQITNSDAVADLNSTIEIKENGVVIASQSNVYAASGGGHFDTAVLQSLRDLEPDTTYTYTVIGTEGVGEIGLAGEGSSLSVRLEHRIVAS